MLSVDTTFNICDGIFLTSKSYPNLSEEAYRRFVGEMFIAKPSIANNQKVGHDLEKSIAKVAWDFFSYQIF